MPTTDIAARRPPAVPDDIALNQTYAHLLARRLVRPLLGTPVRPNHLTLLRLAIGLAACVLLGTGTARTAAWSGVLWVAACVLDRADGELARIGNLRSASGQRLDFAADLLLDAGWFLAAGFGVRGGWLGAAALPLGLVACAAMLAANGAGELNDRLAPQGGKLVRGTGRFHPDDALFLLAPFTWLGWTAPVLLLASGGATVGAALQIARFRRLRRAAAA